jgi:hypothetical protein
MVKAGGKVLITGRDDRASAVAGLKNPVSGGQVAGATADARQRRFGRRSTGRRHVRTLDTLVNNALACFAK